MRNSLGSLASRGITPSSGDSVSRGSFSAGPDGSIKADTNVTGNGSLRMNGTTTNAAGQTNTVNITETAAQQEIEQIASEPGNSSLKMTLAQQGISLTDHSDVGPGRRFETFAEKLRYIRSLKTKVLISVIMSMVSTNGWGPSETEDVTSARDALRVGRRPSSEDSDQPVAKAQKAVQ